MTPIKETQKKYNSRAMLVAIVAGLLLIVAGFAPQGKGLILGTIFSAVNFVLIGFGLPATVGQPGRKRFVKSIGFILFRFALLAVPLVLAATTSRFDLATTIIGIFMVQLTILADHAVKSVLSTSEKRI